MKYIYIKFLFRLFLISIPIIILLVLYLAFDPFKVTRSYSSYFTSGIPEYITLDKNYVSTQTLINNASTNKYDAFIFGNSRSIVYEINDWKNYIHSDKCYHFDAYAENLSGIHQKINFLNQHNYNINNAMLVIDSEVLTNNEEKDIIFLPHPVFGNTNIFSFQLEFFEAFISRNFLFKFLNFKLFNKNTNNFFSSRPIDYNATRNEVTYPYDEKAINNTPSTYYDENKMKVFYNRAPVQAISDPVIHESQYKLLTEIAVIFKAKNTNYRIIINPLYDQKKLNSADLGILNNIFGNSNVFDYSGKNFITDDYHNYYENSHYRPHIARFIMKEIYK